MKIDENFVAQQYGSNRIVFYDALPYPGLRKPGKIARFNGCNCSSADETVHGVQMDNLVHKDKTGWNKGNQFCLEKTLRIVQCCPTWW